MNENFVGHKVKVLSNLIRREFEKMPPVQESNRLTGMQGWMIGYLYDHREEDIFQRDIESRFNIRRSTVTGILQLMEKNGLIVRESVATDARLKKIVLTQKAIDNHTQVQGYIVELEEEICRGISAEKLQIFQEVIDQMIQNIKEP